jgi:ubiquinone/menaquinone biosynthesis C-methylase UbiE
MGEQSAIVTGDDPPVPDWRTLVLPDAWPDRLDFRKPADLWRLLAQIFNKKRPGVNLPAEMPGRERIPNYVLREFHNLPNGNYSKRITRGYVTGFEWVMMGSMGRVRQAVADEMHNSGSVLDVGCGGGRMADALKRAGVDDVWGIDPSPYLLQHAASDYPGIKFVQGVAEQTEFPDQRFDGVTACFLFHEMPPRYLDQALTEFYRILKPGGRLAISEPSPLQLRSSLLSLFKRHGFAGLYFGGLARLVYEPFVDAWHRQNLEAKLSEFGFALIEDRDQLPIRQLFARKVAS